VPKVLPTNGPATQPDQSQQPPPAAPVQPVQQQPPPQMQQPQQQAPPAQVTQEQAPAAVQQQQPAPVQPQQQPPPTEQYQQPVEQYQQPVQQQQPAPVQPQQQQPQAAPAQQVSNAAPGENPHKDKYGKVPYPALKVDSEGAPTAKLEAVPQDYSVQKHWVLKKTDFATDAVYYRFKQWDAQKKVDHFKQQAEDAERLGTSENASKAKKLLEMQRRIATLKAQMEADGYDMAAFAEEPQQAPATPVPASQSQG